MKAWRGRVLGVPRREPRRPALPEQGVSIARPFADRPGPRGGRAKKHHLGDIPVIALGAAIGGADAWEEAGAFGEAEEGRPKRRPPPPSGTPSHDTVGRVLARLAPQEFGGGAAGRTAGVGEAAGLRPVAAPPGVASRGAATGRRPGTPGPTSGRPGGWRPRS